MSAHLAIIKAVLAIAAFVAFLFLCFTVNESWKRRAERRSIRNYQRAVYAARYRAGA
jgi:hypothetical protein